MAFSSILGASRAPAQPSGRGSDLLGPSDNSDSGSDAQGTQELHGDSDAAGTGERGVVSGVDPLEGGDILPDHVVQIGIGPGPDQEARDTEDFTDLASDEDDEDDEDDEADEVDEGNEDAR